MPRSRYSKISRKPGVHWAAVATSCLNCQSLVSDIVSSRADRVRYYSSRGVWLSRRERRAGRMADQPLQDTGVVRGPAVDRDDRAGDVRGPVGREERHEIGALLGRADRRVGGDQLPPARGIAELGFGGRA